MRLWLIRTGGAFGEVKVAWIASFPMKPAEHGSCSGRQPVVANGTELPKVTLSTLSEFSVTAGADTLQPNLIPWEPMLLTVPNLPSARCVRGSVRPLTDTGVSAASIPSKTDGPTPLLTRASP